MTTQWQQMRPHVYPGLPMVSSIARELDFVGQSSRNDHAIGPLVYRQRTETSMAPEERARWNTFRDRNRSSGRPLIYCAFGTMLSDTSSMLERVSAAVRARPDWDLVVGLGGRAESLAAVPDDNVLMLDYAPQLEVLDAADVAIGHGGINTINECISYGVPMVLERSGATDAPGNASRVEHHGVGLRADLASIDSAALAVLIDQVLQDADMRRRVAEMRGHFQRYEHDLVAEQAVERLLGLS